MIFFVYVFFLCMCVFYPVFQTTVCCFFSLPWEIKKQKDNKENGHVRATQIRFGVISIPAWFARSGQ